MNTDSDSIDCGNVNAIVWRDDQLHLLDQRALPANTSYLTLDRVEAIAAAITDMVVRGAPAIGITAAYGVVIAARERYRQSRDHWKTDIQRDMALLAASRPTAVNLFWALQQMQDCIDSISGDPEAMLLQLARSIHENDIRNNHTMGRHGAGLIQSPGNVITHCNTGSLATGGFGTALGVVRQAYADGHIQHVYADETRPWLQGTRLTAWELRQDNIPVSLIVDSAAASLMQSGKISWVIVGADRIAANGDAANKIGTYSLAVLARHHGVRFMVVAPTSTVDLNTPQGGDIAIEQRHASEVLGCGKTCYWPDENASVSAWNPAFDVTPASLIDAIVTEKGVVREPDAAKISHMMSN